MIGKCISSNVGYYFVQTPDRRTFFIHATEIEPDDVGRRYLAEGEEVEFEPSTFAGKTCAVHVRLLSRRDPVPADYEEEGEVKTVRSRGEYCFLLRPFGGCVMLHWTDVAEGPRSENGHVIFRAGQRWRYRVEPPIGDRKDEAWRAVDAVEI